MSQPNYDTLVISGGSHKGMILIGAMQSVMDNIPNKNFVYLIGTSAGSMICYLLAIGYTPIEIMVYICTHRILERMYSFNLIAMINSEGSVSYTPIQETLEKMTLDKIGKFLTMKELRDITGKTLVCATYNRSRQIMEYISPDNYPDLPCLIAVRMSSNIPMLFGKFKYFGFEYVDGGISDNFPIIEAEKLGNKVLGITLLPRIVREEQEDEGFLEYLFSLLYVPINQSTIFRMSLTDKQKTTIFQIPSGTTGFINFNIKSTEKLNMFSEGYKHLKNLLNEQKDERENNKQELEKIERESEALKVSEENKEKESEKKENT